MNEVNRIIINSNSEVRWFESSPLAIYSVDLCKDSGSEKLYVNIKLMNIQPEPLGDIEIDIICYDIIRYEIAKIENYGYHNINIQRNQCFGEDVLIPIENPDTMYVDVILKSASTLDGEKWINESCTPFNVPIKQKSIGSYMGRYLTEFKNLWKEQELAEDKLLYAPCFSGSYWLCACGAFNWSVEESCCSCGVKLDWLMKNSEPPKPEKNESFSLNNDEKSDLNTDSMKNTLVQPDKHEAKQEKIPEPKKKRTFSKVQKGFTAFTAVIIVLGILTACVYFFVIPISSYYQAVSLTNSGEYDEAIEELSKLNGFGDSEQEILRAKYLKAKSLMSEQEYLAAANIFNSISYNDSYEKYLEAMYSYGTQLYSEENYIDSLKVFTDLADYSDSSGQADKAEKAAMSEGTELYEAKEYSEASEMFIQIYDATGNTDALEQANAAFLSQADYLYETSKYVDAIILYESLSGYDHVDVTIKKLDSLKKLLSTSIYSGEGSSVWENTTLQCSLCHSPTLTYQLILDDNGTYQFYCYCSAHDSEDDYKILKGQYKVEDDIIYTLKHNGGTTEWAELCKIENINSDSSVQGKSAKLVITNPFSENGSSLTLYGNILEDDPSLI